jgi:two-component system, cell cycle sensor histidine kinase and response regulator CckA
MGRRYYMAAKPSYEELDKKVKLLEKKVVECEQAAKKLKIQKAYLDMLWNCAPEAIAIADRNHRIIRTNAQFTSMFDYTPEEASGRTCDELIAPEEEFNDATEISFRVGQGEAIRIETVRRKKDGTPICVELMAAPVRIGEKHIGDYASYRDVTGRKQSEGAIKESENKFKAIFEGSHDAITLTVEDGRFLDCNKRALELFGVESKKAFLEKRPADFSPQFQPDGRSSFEVSRALIHKVLKDGGFLQFEWVHQRKTGEIFPAEIILAAIRLGDQEVLQASIRDITERKKAEEERLSLQEQLRQAQKVEAIGQLAGGIAHDFNNALTVILGNAEMILRDVGKRDPLSDGIEEIKKAGERASKLTRQLLAFSRKQILQPDILNLNEAVLGMEKMLRRIIGENIELETNLAPHPGVVEADPGQIEQVIMNLAVNARDAMPMGGKLTIETKDVELGETYARKHVEVMPGSYVMLALSDTGTGMTNDVQERIFEPFFTTKERGKGTGLGLSTVYGIVKQSKGNIWVYSEPGKGTSFKIYLPRVEKTISGRKDATGEIQIPHGSETVLAVEDEEMVRNVVFKFLDKYGYRVLIAANGQEALHICRGHKDPIHLLLTDVVMPGLSGKELAKQAKELRPDLKLLFMSGYTDNAIVKHGILEKGIAFIQKPFTHQGLAWKVRGVLDE